MFELRFEPGLAGLVPMLLLMWLIVRSYVRRLGRRGEHYWTLQEWMDQ